MGQLRLRAPRESTPPPTATPGCDQSLLAELGSSPQLMEKMGLLGPGLACSPRMGWRQPSRAQGSQGSGWVCGKVITRLMCGLCRHQGTMSLGQADGMEHVNCPHTSLLLPAPGQQDPEKAKASCQKQEQGP